MLLLLSVPVAGVAVAQSWYERLVMPGELVAGHADLETKCDNCHTSFSKSSQRRLCLDCHKKVAGDVRDGTGFHGLRPEIGSQECSHCHTDHVGRDADIVQLDEETFDHGSTDFVLRGRHAAVVCTGCHAPKKKFRDAPHACVDCHGDTDPHRGNLGKDCAVCHGEDGWTDTRQFDHDKTDFPLKDAHREVECLSCHIGEVYKGLPKVCADCHRIQDVHGARYGDKCETCHRPTKWDEIGFNHDRDTDFALIGGHKQVKCDTCHTGDLYREEPGTGCADCHGRTDPHNGQLGKMCDTCHTPEGWRREVLFDHDITRFPLIGLHAVVPCEDCHLTPAYRDAPVDCAECHGEDDFHDGRLGDRCDSCHNPNGWKLWVFDHDTQTRYPLTGAHDGLDCNACHTKARSASLRIPRACVSCHARDDVHRGQFGRRCSNCHITRNFRNVRLRR
ncbi:MAG: cytochrome c3 family protein [Paracoccaceae bacterium]